MGRLIMYYSRKTSSEAGLQTTAMSPVTVNTGFTKVSGGFDEQFVVSDYYCYLNLFAVEARREARLLLSHDGNLLGLLCALLRLPNNHFDFALDWIVLEHGTISLLLHVDQIQDDDTRPVLKGSNYFGSLMSFLNGFHDLDFRNVTVAGRKPKGASTAPTRPPVNQRRCVFIYPKTLDEQLRLAPNFSECRCQLHIKPQPLQLEPDNSSLMAQAGQSNPLRAAAKGEVHFCQMHPHAREKNRKLVELSCSRLGNQFSMRDLCAEMVPIASPTRAVPKDFGLAYSYISVIRPDCRWPVAQVLGPEPLLTDFLAIHSWAGLNIHKFYLVEVTVRRGQQIVHITEDKTRKGASEDAPLELRAQLSRLSIITALIRIGTRADPLNTSTTLNCTHCANHRTAPKEFVDMSLPCFSSLKAVSLADRSFCLLGQSVKNADSSFLARAVEALEPNGTFDTTSWQSSKSTDVVNFGQYYCYLLPVSKPFRWMMSRLLGMGALLSGHPDGRDFLTLAPHVCPETFEGIEIQVIRNSEGIEEGSRGVLHFADSKQVNAIYDLKTLLSRLHDIAAEDSGRHWLLGASPVTTGANTPLSSVPGGGPHPPNWVPKGPMPCPKYPDIDASLPANWPGGKGRYCYANFFHEDAKYDIAQILLSGPKVLDLLPELENNKRANLWHGITYSNGWLHVTSGTAKRDVQGYRFMTTTACSSIMLFLQEKEGVYDLRNIRVGGPIDTDKLEAWTPPFVQLSYPEIDATLSPSAPGGVGNYCWASAIDVSQRMEAVLHHKSGPLLSDLLVEGWKPAENWHVYETSLDNRQMTIHVLTWGCEERAPSRSIPSRQLFRRLADHLSQYASDVRNNARVGWTSALGPGKEWDVGFGSDETILHAPTDESWASFVSGFNQSSPFDNLTLDNVAATFARGSDLSLASDGLLVCSDCNLPYEDCKCFFDEEESLPAGARVSDGDEEDPLFWNVKLDNPCEEIIRQDGSKFGVVTINNCRKVVTGELKRAWKTESSIKTNNARLQRAEDFRTSTTFLSSMVDCVSDDWLQPVSVLSLGLSPSAAFRTFGGTKIGHIPSGSIGDTSRDWERIARSRKKKRKPEVLKKEKLHGPDLDKFLDDCIRENWILDTLRRRKEAGLKISKGMLIALRHSRQNKKPPDKFIAKQTPLGKRVVVRLPQPSWIQVQHQSRMAERSAWSSDLSPVIGRSWFARTPQSKSDMSIIVHCDDGRFVKFKPIAVNE